MFCLESLFRIVIQVPEVIPGGLNVCVSTGDHHMKDG